MIQNLHTHTTFCDGKNTPEEMVRAAIAAGMDSLGFSGHAPMPPPNNSWGTAPADLPRYRAEVLRLREKYAGQLEIFLGLEQDFWSPPLTEDWDYIIGSVHCLRRDGVLYAVDNTPEDFRQSVERYYGGDCLAFVEEYYQMVAQAADRTGCQILGHFDLICKFNEGDRLFDTQSPRYQRAALGALEALAGRDLIFEINTGAMSRGYRTAPYPAPWILKAMKERGCRICLSSDTHSAGTVLFAFEQARELARDCGYTEQWVLGEKGFYPVPL